MVAAVRNFIKSKEKCLFLKRRNTTWFVIDPDGITIHPGRIEAMESIAPPHNKKIMQSFMGKINIVRRFISNFVDIVKPLQEMIKKDANFKWKKEIREAFK